MSNDKLREELKNIIVQPSVGAKSKDQQNKGYNATKDVFKSLFTMQPNMSSSSIDLTSIIKSETEFLDDQLNYNTTKTFDDDILNESDQIETLQQYSIEQQILQLRKQLDESYSVFINARDALSGISFVNIEQNFKRESSVLTDKLDSELLLSDDSSKVTKHLNELNEKTKQNMFDIKKHAGSIGELNTFFRVVNQLQKGIRNMEQNHKLMSDLNKEVADSICIDKQYVNNVKNNLDQAYKIAEDPENHPEKINI